MIEHRRVIHVVLQQSNAIVSRLVDLAEQVQLF